MDTRKSRYDNFKELYLYCYYVAGTVGLMSVPVMGIAPESAASAPTIYNAALYLGIGNQLTNILRDVGEELVTQTLIILCFSLSFFCIKTIILFTQKLFKNLRSTSLVLLTLHQF